MKKQIFVLAVTMIAMLFVSNLGQAQSFTLNPKNGWFENVVFDPGKFMDVYSSAVQLNHRRFDDVSKIQIGDTVLFPARTVDGDIEYWIADTPAAHDGRHDCIWRLTERYLAYQLPTKPAVIVIKPQPDPVAPVEKQEIPWWAWLILALLAGGILYLFLRQQLKMHRNPDNHPPVIQGGLSRNLEEAANQIATNNNVTPNNVLATERVVLVRDSGPQTLRVEMEFGDKIKRDVDIKSGEVFVLATLRTNGSNTIQELYRNHCGNKTGPVISSGRINILNRDADGNIVLPTGWRFVKESEYRRPETNATTAITDAPAPAPAPTTTTELTGILAAIKTVMPKDAKSLNLNYEINGQKGNIKLEIK